MIAARDGLGILLGAEAMLQEDLDNGRLVRLFPDHEPLSRPVHVMFPADRYLLPKLRSFVDLMVNELGFAGEADDR